MIRATFGAVLLLAGAAWAAPAVAPPDPALWSALGVDRAAKTLPAPPIEGVAMNGRPVSLQALRGRVVLVYFWASW